MPVSSSSLVSATKPEARENIWLGTMLTFYSIKNTLAKVAHFPKIDYHASFEDLK
jgi:hypothetical protein